LNLIRSHRPFVEHVRVVISEDEQNQTDEQNGDDHNDDNNDDNDDDDNSKDEAKQSDAFGADLENDATTELRRDRTYLILVQLFREEDATTFVEDLDGKPYIAFDDRDTCQIERVVGVETIPSSIKPDSTNDEEAKSPSSLLKSLDDSEGSQKQQPNAAKFPKNHRDDPSPLLLLHPNIGGTISKCDGSLQEEKGESQNKLGSLVRKMTISGHRRREESKIKCAVCLEDLRLEEMKVQVRMNILGKVGGASQPMCTIATTSLEEYPKQTNPKQQQQQQQPSLLTTVCNHTFHLDCLERCTGPCPVCRYDHSGLNETLSQCHVCGSTEHNYVCLICGVVSCGTPQTAYAASASSGSPRFYTSSHAGQHYRETLHAYALDTQTQHVYDFCGQGYVHRLVQNKEDGKIVEVNNWTTGGERSLTPGLSDAQEGEVVHRKLEESAEQYNDLLKSQLNQQRAYYEERLSALKREFSAKNQRARAQDLISALKQEKKSVNQRLSSIQRRNAKVQETVSFLTNMNESLEKNKAALHEKIQQALRDQQESREMFKRYIPALEAKVSKLIMELTEDP